MDGIGPSTVLPLVERLADDLRSRGLTPYIHRPTDPDTHDPALEFATASGKWSTVSVQLFGDGSGFEVGVVAHETIRLDDGWSAVRTAGVWTVGTAWTDDDGVADWDALADDVREAFDLAPRATTGAGPKEIVSPVLVDAVLALRAMGGRSVVGVDGRRDTLRAVVGRTPLVLVAEGRALTARVGRAGKTVRFDGASPVATVDAFVTWFRGADGPAPSTDDGGGTRWAPTTFGP